MNAQHRAEGMAQAIRAIADPRIGDAALQEQEKSQQQHDCCWSPTQNSGAIPIMLL